MTGGRIEILHLITELDIGGAQKALARLLAHLDRQRFEPTVVCLYNGDKAVAQEIRQLGIPVFDLRMTAKWRFDALWRLYRLLRREHPVILHTWMFHATLIGRLVGILAGVPIRISSRRNVEIGGPVREWINRWTLWMDNRVIAVCEEARKAEIHRGGAPPQKVVTIYNGIEVLPLSTREAARENLRAVLGLPPHALLVGIIGRLHPQKGHRVLLEAATHVVARDWQVYFILIGDGPLRHSLEAIAREQGLAGRVHFLGTRHDIPQLLAAMDLFVLSSFWEGMPNAVLEAMATGLPVVATAVGGTPEVVVDGVTGLLVPPRDPVALAQAIERLLADPELRHRMGQAGRERVEQHFSVEQMVRKTEALYEELLYSVDHEALRIAGL